MKRTFRPFETLSSPANKRKTHQEFDVNSYPFNFYASSSSYHKVVVKRIESFPKYISLKCENYQNGFEKKTPAEKTKEVRIVGDWRNVKISIGDRINLILEEDYEKLEYVEVTDAKNFMVLNPDLLLHATQISSSCIREPFMGKNFNRQIFPDKPDAFIGTSVHEIFQTMLEKKDFSYSFFKKVFNEYADEHIVQLFYYQYTKPKFLSELNRFYSKFDVWNRSFFRGGKKRIVVDRIAERGTKKCIRWGELIDMEDSVSSCKWGLKGNIDVSSTVFLDSTSNSVVEGASDSEKEVLVAWELKSSRNEASEENSAYHHHSQLIVYLICMREKYKLFDSSIGPVENGILFYLGSGKIIGEFLNRNIIRSTIQKRNRIVQSFFSRRSYEMRKFEDDKLKKKLENYWEDNYQSQRERSLSEYLNVLLTDLVDSVPSSTENNESAPIEILSEGVGVIACTQGEYDHCDEVLINLPRPKPLNTLDSGRCGKCFHREPCMIYHAIMEQGVCFDEKYPDYSKFEKLYEEIGKELDSKELKSFARKWLSLIDLAELETTYFTTSSRNRSIPYTGSYWNLTGPQRENLGVCLSCMEGKLINKFSQNKCYYEFRKEKSINHKPLTVISDFRKGDHVVISTETGILGIAGGSILDIQKNKLVVTVFGDLSLPYRKEAPYKVLYRIDKIPYAGNFSVMRSNIFELFKKERGKMRNMVLGGKPPEFTGNQFYPINSPNISKPMFQITNYLSSKFPWFQRLNPDQKTAIFRILETGDFLLIHGMPGTGKTTTICHAIEVLVVGFGKRVLVTAYTHTAVNHILEILAKKGLTNLIYRVGKPDKIEDLDILLSCTEQRFLDDVRNERMGNMDSIEIFEKNIIKKMVFGVTCIGIKSSLVLKALQHRAIKKNENYPYWFDYCVMDEATQITLPLAFSPLAYGCRRVMIGDPFQLSPISRGKKSSLMGMSTSLFSYLVGKVTERTRNDENWEKAYIQLTYQYRMNEMIMSIPNEVVYGGKLKCGNDSVKNSKLNFPGLEKFFERVSSTKADLWIKDIFSEDSSPVVFVDIDAYGQKRYEQRKGEEICNSFEAGVVMQICAYVLHFIGGSPSQIGIMTPYNLQVEKICDNLNLLKENLKKNNRFRNGITYSQSEEEEKSLENIKLYTIDRFQGLDSDLVILSLVRSNDKGEISGIMNDLKRINVAFTRAKKKFIIVGSLSTHKNRKPFSLFLDVITKNKWVHELQPQQLEICGRWLKSNFTWEPVIQYDKEPEEEEEIIEVNEFMNNIVSPPPIPPIPADNVSFVSTDGNRSLMENIPPQIISVQVNHVNNMVAPPPPPPPFPKDSGVISEVSNAGNSSNSDLSGLFIDPKVSRNEVYLESSDEEGLRSIENNTPSNEQVQDKLSPLEKECVDKEEELAEEEEVEGEGEMSVNLDNNEEEIFNWGVDSVIEMIPPPVIPPSRNKEKKNKKPVDVYRPKWTMNPFLVRKFKEKQKERVREVYSLSNTFLGLYGKTNFEKRSRKFKDPSNV